MLSGNSKVLEIFPISQVIENGLPKLGYSESNKPKIYYKTPKAIFSKGQFFVDANKCQTVDIYGVKAKDEIQKLVALIITSLKSKEKGKYLTIKVNFFAKENLIEKEGEIKIRGQEELLHSELIKH